MVRRRVEVWSVPNDPAGFRLLCEPPVLAVSTNDRAGDEVPGSGSITIPADYDRLDLIVDLDPSDVAGSAFSSLIVISQELPNPDSASGASPTIWTPVFEFFADDSSEKMTDVGPAVTITGPEIRSALDDGIVYPKSTNEPHYQWGAPTITGNADLLESVVADEELTIWIVPTGGSDPSGTWTLTINGQTTNPLDWDATPAEIKTAIEAAVTTISEAKVSGSGTETDPWYVILVDDPPVNQTIVSNSSVVDGDFFLSIEREGGQATPTFYTNSQTIDGIPYGNTGGGTLAVVDDPAGGGGRALRIVGTTEFIGTQQILDVEVGSTGYASVEIYPTSALDAFRLVLRTATEDEDFVASSGGSGGYEGTTLTADQWNTLEIDPFQLLASHGSRLILRAAVVSQGNPSEFYIRNLRYHPGLPGTTAGDISQTLSALPAARGALDWIDFSRYDATLDSNGNAWDESALAFQADAGEQLGTHVHGDLQEIGYELDLVRIPDDELGSGSGTIPSHYLDLFNPGGRAPAVSLNAQITVGAGISDGTIAKRRVPHTHILVETYDGLFVETTDARLAGLPRREGFIRAEQARDTATAQKLGEAILDAEIENLFAAQVTLTGDQIVAYRDFDIGSTVPYVLGASRAGRHNRRIHTISMAFDGETWRDTITASKVYAGASGGGGDSPLVLEALRKIYAEFIRRRDFGRKGGALIPAAIPDASNYTQTSVAATPAIGDAFTYNDLELTSSASVSLPGTVSVGDYLFFSCRGSVTAAPTGFTQLDFDGVDVYLFGAVADSAIVSAGTIDVPVTASSWLRLQGVRIDGTGADWTANPPEVSAFATGSASQPNPPAVNAITPSATHFVIAGYHSNNSVASEGADVPPAGYSNLTTLGAAGGPNHHAHLAVNAVTITTNEDPAAGWHSMSITRGWVAFTVAFLAGSTDPALVGFPVGIDDIDFDHGDLAGLDDDDHPHYALTDGTRAFTGDLDLGGNTISDVGDPTLDQDAATKAYVDNSGGTSADDPYIWRPLLDDDGAIVVDDDGNAVMGYGPA